MFRSMTLNGRVGSICGISRAAAQRLGIFFRALKAVHARSVTPITKRGVATGQS